MNILIPNSWLKDYLETNATPQQFGSAMSLTSVSIERMEKIDDDVVYDIEVTSNRPDLMSIQGIAREASAVLPEAGYKATFIPHKLLLYPTTSKTSPLITIQNDSTLVNRIMAVIMEVDIKPSPSLISKRLERSGIRSINNVVDITNYIMREIGHPSHVFDYDRLTTKKLIIRKSKKGEKIVTLDDKEYQLSGEDIVADDGTGKIVDLLGIMGTANSVVTNETKRILFFLDNNNPHLLRKTSMGLGIRTEAAILNEKEVDPELMKPAIMRGIELYKELANGKLLSEIIDIYPNKPQIKKVSVSFERINSLIGIAIPEKTVVSILTNLDFKVLSNRLGIVVDIPTNRLNDIDIAEDIIEEVARVHGYTKIPNVLPQVTHQNYYHQDQNEFYWISKIKEALKFWGFNETYTYSLVSESLFDGPIESAIKLKNPLDEDHMYLRNSIVPSLIQVIYESKKRDIFKLFEIANVYLKKENTLPSEFLHLACVIKEPNTNFYTIKGVIEQLFKILGIPNYKFVKKNDGISGATIQIEGENIGQVEVEQELSFELNLSQILKKVTSKKVYIQPAKYPPIIEDVRIQLSPHYAFQEIKNLILKTSDLIQDVTLLDVYENKKTFRITYLNKKNNLTNEDILPIRESLQNNLRKEFKAVVG